MKKRLIFLSSILFFILSFKAQQKVNQGPQPTKDKTVYKGVTDLSCGLEINFGRFNKCRQIIKIRLSIQVKF